MTYVLAYDIGTTGVKTCLFEIGSSITLLAGDSEFWRKDFKLHRAVRKNDVKTARELVAAGADVNEGLDSDGRTPLIDAARFNKKDAVRFLLENKADVNKASDNGWTPLHWVVSQGKLSMLKTLVEAGADVNAADKLGNTPLHYAAKFEQYGFVSYLIKHGARTDVRNHEGKTPKDLEMESKAKRLYWS